MACKEPTLRKSFTIQRYDALCACPYGSFQYLAAGLANGVVTLLPTSPEYKVRRYVGHKAAVTCIKSCTNAPNLVTGSVDGTVRLWAGNEEGDSVTIDAGSGEIVSMGISSKYDRLLISGSDGKPVIWDPRYCKHISTLEEHAQSVNTCDLSSDGLVALTGSSDGYFRLFDVRIGKMTHQFDCRDAVTAVSLRQTGSAIAAGCSNGTVLLWDSRTQTALNDTVLHENKITSLAFHPLKPLLLTASEDGHIGICDGDTRNLIFTLQCHTSCVRNVAWAVDGQVFSSVGADNRIVLWDEPVVEYERHIPEIVNKQKVRTPTKQKLGKFNEPLPRDEPPPPEPEIGVKIPVKCEEADKMKKYISVMHQITDQIANLSKMLSKLESRINVIDEQIEILEVEKRRQAKRALQGRK
ncbi:WD40 domain containing protein [Tritrichomonas foetus]|uniref:WD40 domain containing protein n=1 Tax=Tritrichomonas foetus TaxID=1144522 RepID=A0A1J4KVP8_9EUKA|nr:WD40 domain containing protein [Tritrichomonas foetus]|eukprot:OHT13774.1 WD40 domain containing protein [Tritrichomonas foetus]